LVLFNGELCFDACEFTLAPRNGILQCITERITLSVNPIGKIIVLARHRVIPALADARFRLVAYASNDPPFKIRSREVLINAKSGLALT
jgi:hypothetical protein